MSIDVKAVRDRALHYLTSDIAASIGLTLQQLQQFVDGGMQTLSEDQLQRLQRELRSRRASTMTKPTVRADVLREALRGRALSDIA